MHFTQFMADEHVNGISLKALVDKEKNRVIFAESNGDFIDVLFSFLTMPMGTIIRLTRNQPPTVRIGCMNNLYKSVENFDVQHLRTEACKVMLLYPRNGAETHCKNLKLKIDDGEPKRYFCCRSFGCTCNDYQLLSHYNTNLCHCGKPMDREISLLKRESKNLFDGGVFVRGLTRLIISDELKLMPPSTAASFSLFSKLGITDASTIEERTFDVGVNEVLNLLKYSLMSNGPLTDTLLKHEPVPELSKGNIDQRSFIQSDIEGEPSNGTGQICVKLIVSKSKNMVCYAEAREDFVDLLFSFLTVPLGYIVKEMQGGSSKGCMDHLYKSVQDLDTEQSLKSDEHKIMLVSPKLAPGFSYENHPFDIDEVLEQPYYGQWYASDLLNRTTDETLINFENPPILTLIDPKSHYMETTSGKGFVKGPSKFTVTDNLVVTPISPVSGVSVLSKLKVPFNDIEERVVHLGNEEASRLLVASFVSESALTSAFIRREPKQEE